MTKGNMLGIGLLHLIGGFSRGSCTLNAETIMATSSGNAHARPQSAYAPVSVGRELGQLPACFRQFPGLIQGIDFMQHVLPSRIILSRRL